MNGKSGKSPEEDSKIAKPTADSDHPMEKDVTRNTPGPGREGRENLKQRAEWFRRRSGEK
jgi:hypothetical protein